MEIDSDFFLKKKYVPRKERSDITSTYHNKKGL